jgi:hypothetical protein
VPNAWQQQPSSVALGTEYPHRCHAFASIQHENPGVGPATKPIAKWIAASAMLVLALASIVLFATRSSPVLVRLDLEPDLLTTQCVFSVLNPFRDREPERIAQEHLRALRQGDTSIIGSFLNPEAAAHIMKAEARVPVVAWRLVDRHDTASTSRLAYSITRGGGYSYPAEAFFFFTRANNRWVLERYCPIY